MSSPPPSSPAIEDLASLEELDRDRLTLFVCGPGQGEAILVALPERGWLVLDGAGIRKSFPQESVLKRFRLADEPIDGVLLTHPHRDHYRGFTELLDEYGDDVRHVGCLSLYFEDMGKSSAEIELHALEGGVDPDSPLDHLSGGVRSVLERVRDEWESDASRVLSLVSGTSIPLSSAAATARVLAPDVAGATKFLRSSGLGHRIKQHANDLSAVIEITFRGTRIVLGGDLPEVVQAKGKAVPVPTGWQTVCANHGLRAAHSGLKVPHHGSKEALATCLVARSGDTRRTWAVTPFNMRPHLPSFEAGQGIDVMLAQEPELHLSAMPRAWSAQTPLPPRVSRSSVTAAGVPTVALPAAFSAPTPTGNPSGLDPEQCIWALVFDDAGELVARYRGSGSTLIHA